MAPCGNNVSLINAALAQKTLLIGSYIFYNPCELSFEIGVKTFREVF